ncbi:hypothetical protein LKL48_15225, partial [Listeria monocytogenes]|nr:hypothetical protein [Listeria monocytogenes]
MGKKDSTRVEPGTENGVNGTHQLLTRIGCPVPTELLVRQLLEGVNETLEVIGTQIGVGLDAFLLFKGGQGILVNVSVDTLDDLAVHLDEAAVAVPRKPLIASFLSDGLNGVVRDAEVEDGVHHAGHRDHGARSHGDQQRLLVVTEDATGALLKSLKAVPYLG